MSEKLSEDEGLALLMDVSNQLAGASGATPLIDTALQTVKAAAAMMVLAVKEGMRTGDQEPRYVIEPRIEPSPRQ